MHAIVASSLPRHQRKSQHMTTLDTTAAVARLMRFLSVPGITGEEAAIAREVTAALKEAGVPAKAIRLDDANTRIPVPTQTGNLIVHLPGRGSLGNAQPLLFMTHLDTVPLCAGAKPKLKGNRIINEAPTALGGDNRAGCGVLVTLAAELAKQKLDHPPLTLVFCVREESGLWGARHIKLEDIGPVSMGFNFDGRSPADVVVGAVGADHWEVEISGRASHAGVAPERGISSTMILSLALAEVRAGGWFGKVVKGERKGTSNVGPVTGGAGRPAGDATNVVTDYVHVQGESRSQDQKFFKEITAAFKQAFINAAAAVTNSEGKTGKIKFTSMTRYYPFDMKEKAPVVRHAIAAVKEAGLKPNVCLASGGLDANWLVRHGIPTVTFGAGQNEVHTVDEWINVDEYQRACRLAVTLATLR
jgi:tripeptide aminopeptidase